MDGYLIHVVLCFVRREGRFRYSKARGAWSVLDRRHPCAFVGCESGLGVPLDATGRVARGLCLPQGLRSGVLVRVGGLTS